MGILMETTRINLGTASCRRQRAEPEYFGAMGSPSEYYPETLHTIAINTRETEFGSIVEQIPITLRTYKQFPANGSSLSGYGFPPQKIITSFVPAPRVPETEMPSTSTFRQSQVKDEVKDDKISRAPPKKKWIREYLEEEPKSPVSVRVVTGLSVTPRSNGVVRPTSPVPVAPPCTPAPSLAAAAPDPVVALAATAPAPLDFVQEHSRPRTTSNSHGPPQIPSPPSVSSNGSGSGSSGSSNSAPRAGTREVHNKLEKNRRAHLKECFELLKRQLPATSDDKKTSNLSILGSAIRYIQVLRRKERECEHEMERLAREKIAAQQRLAALKREVSVRATVRPRSIDSSSEEKDESMNGQILGIPISVVRTSYGSRHNTLTLTTLAPADGPTQNGQSVENGVANTLSTALVHPAQIHLPLSQVVGSGGLVVGPAALQLLSTSGGLRVLQAPTIHTNGISTGDTNRIPKENGIVSPTPVSTEGGSVVVSGLTPLVVSQPAAHLLQTHTLTHKMVETQMVKGTVAPLTVSAQYLSATTIMKPVVVVSSSHTTTAAAPTQPAPPT
ncbi:max-binding protein MNT-like isoform X3 [Achroia grisella]|uniref:max-binding protein MNT-like isoform X3 n=1 Tax=Achroia grisella TaxID=688607 RepID=UPI0027D287E6|nr:max-binding protein MNT-like isoform X3 [Achroia grisella]